MFKCKKEECEYESEVKGFCAKCGSETEEFEKSDEKKLDDIISRIGETVSKAVDKKFDEAGLNSIEDKTDIQKDVETYEGKMEYLKGIMSKTDKSVLERTPKDEEKSVLSKLRGVYLFKHIFLFSKTKDQMHLEHVKALAEGVDADGGYTVPTEFRSELLEDLQDEAVMRPLVRVIPMASDSMEMPELATLPKTSWGSENTSIETTTVAFSQFTLSVNRMDSLLYMSRELNFDSALNMVGLISRLFAEAVAREEDRVIVNGSGSGQPKGILQETISGIDNGNDDDTLAPNIKKLPFKLGTKYRKRAVWLLNSQSLGTIGALQDDNKQFLFKEGIEGETPHRLAGYKVIEQNDMPINTLLFGDFNQYILGDREKMSIESTSEGAGTFEKHQIAIKVTERIDGKVAITNGFRTITNAGIL
jgi:HK97 family phage major capsid protein